MVVLLQLSWIGSVMATTMSEQLDHVPRQTRSQASLNRMLAATKTLLTEQGPNFTVLQIGELANVSIGSIYLRFDGKADLLRAAEISILEELEEEQAKAILTARRSAHSLHDLIARLVDGLIEAWRKRASVLTNFFITSGSDEVVSEHMARSWDEVEQLFTEALIGRRGEISHPDPHRALSAIFRLFQASISQSAAFGRGSRPIDEHDWNILKDDLRRISSAYLRGNLEAL